ncbi:hypothetical protein DYB30_013944 [Aphanomyces astaci]|uniref:Uncharacterized protein n=1 Tax=Aphanomyces astaci TaxID=112090 RepID=A0A397E9C2_APHAT|nr:hypothetical protein DYB30_013944 [Aphanomyces astaci]
MKVYRLQGCHVGYLPLRLIKRKYVLKNKIALVVDDLRRSSSRAQHDKVSKCRAAGCGDDFATVLWALLFRYEDVFRLSLDRDPLANMAPLRVTLKAGAESVLCKARRYSKEQRDFMSKHVEELQAACNVEAL